jgi:hypothetical protein
MDYYIFIVMQEAENNKIQNEANRLNKQIQMGKFKLDEIVVAFDRSTVEASCVQNLHTHE